MSSEHCLFLEWLYILFRILIGRNNCSIFESSETKRYNRKVLENSKENWRERKDRCNLFQGNSFYLWVVLLYLFVLNTLNLISETLSLNTAILTSSSEIALGSLKIFLNQKWIWKLYRTQVAHGIFVHSNTIICVIRSSFFIYFFFFIVSYLFVLYFLTSCLTLDKSSQSLQNCIVLLRVLFFSCRMGISWIDLMNTILKGF